MYIALDGPGFYKALTVTDTAQELKVNSERYDQRRIVTAQPTDGIIYYGFDNQVTAATGTAIFKNQLWKMEMLGYYGEVWLVADTGKSVVTKIAEVG